MKSTESNAVRSFGITQVGSIPWGTHLCQFYESKQDLVDILVPYFAQGLRSNEFCMWVTSPPLEVAEAKKAIAKSIPDVNKYLRRGQLEVVSYSDWYLQDGKFDCNRVLQGWVEKEKNALKNGFEGLRLTGNTFWIERNLWQSFVDYEEAVNSVIGEYKMLALCTYCLTNCSGTDVLDVVRNHVGTLLKQGDKWVLVENVLGRKKAEAQIREQLQMLDLAHIIVKNMNDEIIFWNTGAQKLYGFSKEEALKKIPRQLLKTKFPIPIQQIKQELLRSGNWEGELIHTKADGNQITVASHWTLHRDNKGTPVAIIEVNNDISELKKAEKEIERLASFPTLNPNAIFEADFEGKVVYCNPATKKLFPDFEDLGLSHPFLSDWNHAVRPFIDKTKSTFGREVNVAGHWYYETLYFVPQTEKIRVYAVDIDELKKAEEALSKSEQRWSTTLSSIGDAVIATDVAGKISFMNLEAEKLTGWTLSDAYQKPVNSVFKIVNEQTRLEVENPIDRVLREGLVVGLANHTVLIKKGGSEVPIDDSGAPIKDKEGKTTGVVLIFRDITEHKKAEAAVRRQAELIDLGPDAIKVRKLDGIVTFWNKGAEKLYGMTKNEATGQDINTLLKTEFPQPLYEILNKVKADGKWSGEIVHTCKNGDKLVVQSYWLAKLGSDGKIVEILESNMDITQRIELQSKLEESAVRVKEYANQMEDLANQRAAQLKDAERLAAIGATAGMVGHDIRNPLQAITGDVYLAKSELDGLPDGEEKNAILESLVETEKNVDYINKIVQDLQDFARPLNPNPGEADLKLIIDRLLAKNHLPENVKVTVKVQPDARKIVADSDYLTRILYNLVTNAVQAMPQGGKLTIQVNKETNDVLVAVKDTGVGIPEAVRSKLFTPMFTTKSKGQGFGLPVVKRMTEALGGTVTFESQEGKGTTFTIRLPPPTKKQ